MTSGGRAWRCTSCGYIHRGDTPPDQCPVCGAPAAEFEPYVEQGVAAGGAATQWRCVNCGYVHDAAVAPEVCPVCGGPAAEFEPLTSVSTPRTGGGEVFRAVIVGAGIAGVSAAEAIRSAAPGAQITLIAGETVPPYYRLNLTRYLAGEIEIGELPMHPLEWYDENRITLRAGARVEALDLEARNVSLAGGAAVGYDRLVLAMGAHPFVPPIPGAEREGVVTLRDRSDAEEILDRALGGRPVVVIGGGVLGLETAGALAHRGAEVTLVEGHDWLMPRQLNREAGGLLGAHVGSLGIRLERNAKTRELAGGASVTSVELADGRSLPAGLVILATGVRPNTHLARKAGLEVNQGVVVGNYMMASAGGVWAAGDVAEHNGVLYGTWAASQYQGSIAGMNTAGLSVSYGGQPRSNTLKVLGVDLTSIGQFEPADGSFEVVDRRDDTGYLHFVFQHGVLVGAILMGETTMGVAVKTAIETRSDFSGVLAAGATAAGVLARLGAT